MHEGTSSVALPVMPNAPKDTATRYMCAAAYLNSEFRDHTLDMLVRDTLHAVCPSFGVDSVAILRHAVSADAMVLRRDQQLAWLWGVGVAALLVAGSLGGGPPVIGGTVAAAGVAIMVMAWMICHLHLSHMRRRVLGLMRPGTSPLDSAPPADPAIEARLAALATSNLIVYDVAQGDPFVGSGRLLQNVIIPPVNVTVAGTDATGATKPLVAFDAIDLHRYLAKQIPRVGFDHLAARNRLYIQGDHAQHLREILPDRLYRPETRAPSDLVKSGAIQNQDYARTYLCLERVSSGGEIVVSMFIRARLVGTQKALSLESLTYVLPPVKKAIKAAMGELPTRGFEAFTSALGESRRECVSLLLRAPARCLGDPRERRWRRYETTARREIKAGRPFDHGAATSIREAWADYATHDRFKLNDVIDDAQRLRNQLLECVETFLDQHGVDTTAFKNEARLVNQHITNYTFDSVSGTGNYFGGHGQVNNNGNTQAPPTAP